MSSSAAMGVRGEEMAADWLRQHGYTIRNRNWRSGRTEIDIIAETSEYIVFVEVKTRSADYQVNPADAVNVPKQRTIIFAASNLYRNSTILIRRRGLTLSPSLSTELTGR